MTNTATLTDTELSAALSGLLTQLATPGAFELACLEGRNLHDEALTLAVESDRRRGVVRLQA